MRTSFQKLAIIITITLASSTLAHAADDASQKQFECTLTDTINKDSTPGTAKDAFTAATPEIYLICDSDQVKKGDNIKASWIAIDTNNAAPANYDIADKALSITKDLEDGQVFTSNLSLSKPTNGWPVGKYKVDLYLNEKLVDSFNFNISEKG